ncbi:hypothetical protein MFIFM68171_10129 [Madurella fahalii]|uniref:Calcineurin-like phosphoesterase domain-containing protein n=1 Tax=Madurella fahalii TaxID=1157608 RepID=A0ABQ0GQ94_9PEZI
MHPKCTPSVRTRFLIIADTHGYRFLPDSKPLRPIDVVIHCGDVTGDSKLSEYKAAIQLLREIEAPLKLVIPGNHDFTLDTPAFQQMCYKSRRRCNRGLLQHYYGSPGEARRLFDEARREGIIYLEEGTHRFSLQNGASLTVYASPYTPSFGSPGFQYNAKRGHDFAIPKDVDVAITHGPPRGMLDRSWMTGEHVGSPELFSAVARARPRLHCFGHIHEGWGAEVVTWGDGGDGGDGSEQRALGNSRRSSSTVLADLGSILPLKGDAADMVKEKEQRLAEYARGKCVKTSHCAGDALPIEPGLQTLFVNAAVVGTPIRPPWVVDIELPAAQSEGDGGAE